MVDEKKLFERLLKQKRDAELAIEDAKKKIEWINEIMKDEESSHTHLSGSIDVSSNVKGYIEDHLSTPEIAKTVLRQNPDIWIGSGRIAVRADEAGLWPHKPKSYKSVMSSTMKRLAENRTLWLQTKPGKNKAMLYKWAGENRELTENNKELDEIIN